MDERVRRHREEILAAVRRDRDNVNIRGNAIEQLVTEGINRHGFADLEFELTDPLNRARPLRLLIDIKTHIAHRSANPKHYNIGGLLEQLSDGRTLTYIYVIYLDPEEGSVRTHLINNFDPHIIKHTRTQFHWAGRDSRGTTQLDSGLEEKYAREWEAVPDEKTALQFVHELIDI